MAHLAVRHKVQDYAKWKAGFDAFAPARKAGGEISYQIYHVDGDRNELIVLMEWDTIANAKTMMASDATKVAMEGAGVASEPVVFFLNAGDSGRP